MSRRTMAAATAAVLGAIAGTAAGVTIGVLTGWYAAAPEPPTFEERCPVEAVHVSPPNATINAPLGGRYALHRCADTGQTFRVWLD